MMTEIFLLSIKVVSDILKERADNQENDYTDGEGGDDAYRLKSIHRIIWEDKKKKKKDEHNCLKNTDTFIGLFFRRDSVIVAKTVKAIREIPVDTVTDKSS